VGAYGIDMLQFATAVGDRSLADVPRTDWVGLLQDMKEEGAWKQATHRRKMSALGSFYDWWYDIGENDGHNPIRHLPKPKLPQRMPKSLEIAEVRAFFETLVARMNDGSHDAILYRLDWLILGLCYYAGLRISEPLSLRISSLSRDEHGHRTGLILGKGNHEALIVIPEEMGPTFELWLLSRPEATSTRDRDFVFLHPWHHGRITPRRAQHRIKLLARDAGIGEDRAGQVTPHSLRHSIATHLLRGGTDIALVQQLLRHASISTTQTYVQATREEVNSMAYGVKVLDRAG
jgi:site-specific recombinase XerD